MKKQLYLFLNAVRFYTRIPVPSAIPYSEELLNRSTRYFPLIGLLVGGIGAGTYLLLTRILPEPLVLLLSMLTTIYATGAFHEDGFADFCDGFGGGYTKEKILTIMKDSRIGTYGSIGLVGMLATKFLSLQSLHGVSVALVLLAAHPISRLMPVLVIFTTNYSREDASSKSKPIGKKGKTSDLVFAIIFGLILLTQLPWHYTICVLPCMLLLTLFFRNYIVRKIDGYTGDCLGALQQLSEVLFYLGWVVYSTVRL
jgi:adenosylcobinamide-GDP ribazoletransferase